MRCPNKGRCSNQFNLSRSLHDFADHRHRRQSDLGVSGDAGDRGEGSCGRQLLAGAAPTGKRHRGFGRQAIGQQGVGYWGDGPRIEQEDLGARGLGDVPPINARRLGR